MIVGVVVIVKKDVKIVIFVLDNVFGCEGIVVFKVGVKKLGVNIVNE